MAENQIFQIKKSIRTKFIGHLSRYMGIIMFEIILVVMIVSTMAFLKISNAQLRDISALLSIQLADELNKDELDTNILNSKLAAMANIPSISFAAIRNEHNQIVAYWARKSDSYNNAAHETLQPGELKIGNSLFHSLYHFETSKFYPYNIQLSTDPYILADNILSLYIFGYLALFLAFTGAVIVLYFIIKRIFIRPIESVSETAQQIFSKKDLSIEIPLTTDDEIAQLASILNANNRAMLEIFNDVAGCCKTFQTIVDDLEFARHDVNSNIVEIRDYAKQTRAKMNVLTASFNDVTVQLQDLNAQAERSSTAIYEMEQVNMEVVNNLATMGHTVNNSINAIEHMSDSIKTTANNIATLNNEITAVNMATQRLDSSIGIEEKRAKETTELAKNLANDASNGMKVIEETINGINDIQASSDNVSQIISQLGKYAKNIGNILRVIEEVTNQTNLLALNAAIIAAQAGEHGKGFAVVSNEIAALANRTKESTKEIAQVIVTIQKASKEAIEAMKADQLSIQKGTNLGQEAAKSFNNLRISAINSAEQLQQMADATMAQAGEVRAVSMAIKTISNALNDMDVAAHKQSEEALSMTDSANQMSLLNRQVARSSEEQDKSSKEVLNTIGFISTKSSLVSQRQQEQTENTAVAADAINQIDNRAERQLLLMERLNAIIETINNQAELLNNSINKYNL